MAKIKIISQISYPMLSINSLSENPSPMHSNESISETICIFRAITANEQISVDIILVKISSLWSQESGVRYTVSIICQLCSSQTQRSTLKTHKLQWHQKILICRIELWCSKIRMKIEMDWFSRAVLWNSWKWYRKCYSIQSIR